jgi:DnaJ-class molecular chaperone
MALVECRSCHGKGTITGTNGVEYDCRKCDGSGQYEDGK